MRQWIPVTLCLRHSHDCMLEAAKCRERSTPCCTQGSQMEPMPEWRSLHEMAVVASLIQQHGQELAERYLLHENIQQYKLACAYQEFS